MFREESGFSLVELAIYIVLLGIVSAIVAATVLSIFRSEKSVSGLTTSANESQLFVTVLNQDIRSARELAVRDGGARLVASVASRQSPITWTCVTWQVSGSGGEYSVTRNGNVFVENVRADGTEPFFSTASGSDVGQGEEDTVDYKFIATDDSSGRVEVRGAVSNVAQGTHGAPKHCT